MTLVQIGGFIEMSNTGRFRDLIRVSIKIDQIERTLRYIFIAMNVAN